MGRARSLAVLSVVVLAALVCIPAAASASSFTWDLTHDFTTTSPGANPDEDSYGGHPWSYEEGGGNRLPSFSTSISGGLRGWTDGGAPLVAMNASGNPITNGTTTYPVAQVAMQPSTTRPAVIAWTAPVGGTVSITGGVSGDDPGSLICPDDATWQLAGPGVLQGAGPISTSANVTTGDRITLSLTAGLLSKTLNNAGCDGHSVTLSISEVASAPRVTLTSPANGATITGGQPTFAGAADGGFGVSNTVRVHVFNSAGAEIETLTTTAAGGAYRVTASPVLPDGTYTAQAEQDSASGAQGLSGKNTFLLQTAAPTITLNSPGAAPLHTATPILTGVAAHSTSVRIIVYPGDTTNSTPTATATGSSAENGGFSIRLPTLADGRYTVIAADGTGGPSHPVTFRVKVHAPALTLTDPLSGGHLSQAAPVFMGAGGSALGDGPRVSLQLFHGSSTTAKSLGSKRANLANGSWILEWGTHLALGTYTARVSQGDDAGHTATITRTFLVVPANSAIGSAVNISGTGEATVPVWCTAPSTLKCTGTVLILTKKTYRTSGGALAGRLRVMFAYVSITGGRTITVKRRVQADAFHALRRARKVPVVVVATLRSANGQPHSLGVTRVITVRSARRR